MRCRGCGEEKKLINAHIIPKSFYMNLRSDGNHLDVIHNSRPERKMKSYIGDYDQDILCKECDSLFEKGDHYAKELLIDRFPLFKELKNHDTLVGWDMGKIDFDLLKHFFLSVLWRASITTRPFFKHVNLGKHEDEVKKIIWGKSTDINNTYTIVLSKFIPKVDTTIEKTILDPDFHRLDGLNYYRLYLAGYTAWIKVDKRRAQDRLAKIELSNSQTIIVARDFDRSKEKAILTESMIEHMKHNPYLHSVGH